MPKDINNNWLVLHCTICGEPRYTHNQINQIHKGCYYCGKDTAMQVLEPEEYEDDDVDWLHHEEIFMSFIDNLYDKINIFCKKEKLGGRLSAKIMKPLSDELNLVIENHQYENY